LSLSIVRSNNNKGKFKIMKNLKIQKLSGCCCNLFRELACNLLLSSCKKKYMVSAAKVCLRGNFFVSNL